MSGLIKINFYFLIMGTHSLESYFYVCVCVFCKKHDTVRKLHCSE